jgi:molecular chaperone GrpE
MQHNQGGHGSPETAAPERGQDAAPSTDTSPETLGAELEAARAEAQENFARYQRAMADFQNYKRRTEEERAQAGRLANLAFVLNILPVVDDLQRALDSLDAKLAGLQWVEGIRAILRKFEGALQASGVTEIPAEGLEFDPNVHEAIGEDIGEEGKVVRVLQKGYKMGDRVIRPAMVMVGNGAKSE